MPFSHNERLMNYLLDLVKIPSITGTASEKEAALFIHRTLGALPYFQKHPELLALIDAHDPTSEVDKYSVLAIVKAARPTPRTVLMIGHFDVVDVDVYGPYRDKAWFPHALTEDLGRAELPPDARADLDSGDWLFGRGIMDMKLGVALEMALLAEFSEKTDLFDVNLAFLSVCDEENNSAGMRSSVVHLARACREHHLEPIAALNTEPTDAGAPQADRHAIFSGCVGKIMPAFYVQGKEAHVGNYFEGLSAALISSYLTQVIEANPDYADRDDREIALPYIALNQKCIRKAYSVTIPNRSLSYFHYSTLTKSPSRVLKEMTAAARQAAEKTRAHLAESYQKMREHGYGGHTTPRWPITVMTYEDLCRRLDTLEKGLSQRIIKSCTDPFPQNRDLRDISIEILEKMLDRLRLEQAAIVVGFLPPYYPHRSSSGSTEKEINLRQAISETIDYAARKHGIDMKWIKYFGGICDLSYIGGQHRESDLQSLTRNLPGWGPAYSIPFEEIAQTDAPIVNIGPMGRDAHKYTERLDLPYSLNTLPDLIRFFIHALE